VVAVKVMHKSSKILISFREVSMMQKILFRKVSVISIFDILLVFSSAVFSEVKLPAIISDNMVLQQKTSVPIWGWAEPGEKVTVKGSWQWFWGTSTNADVDGKWKVKIRTPKAGNPQTLTITGNNEIVLNDVLIGEVWVCSGQSNMEMRLSSTDNASESAATANYPEIRFFTVKRSVSHVPLDDCEGEWTMCSPENVADFSAVGYYFGKKLHEDLRVPVGLIHSSWGGTPAEAWTPNEDLKAEPEFDPIFDVWQQRTIEYPQKQKEYEKALAEWDKQVKEAENSGVVELKKPHAPFGPDNPRYPASLYNAMIKPIIPYTIKGVIWYQGESNGSRGYQYRKLFPVLIQSWRGNWQQGDFPFYFVQLANYKQSKPEPVDDNWAELREAQLMALSLPNTGMAVAIDIGDSKTIHPKNKKDVGNRLALWALAKDYGKKIPYSGPLYKSMQIRGNKIVLEFDHIFGGLVAKDNKPLTHFSIAGQDKKFVWADAEIVDDTVVVSSPQVLRPLAVRYAWQINPQGCNLYNKANLPASPFRTDNWPGITVNSIQP
jgi:sialate O-acetylesterase